MLGAPIFLWPFIDEPPSSCLINPLQLNVVLRTDLSVFPDDYDIPDLFPSIIEQSHKGVVLLDWPGRTLRVDPLRFPNLQRVFQCGLHAIKTMKPL